MSEGRGSAADAPGPILFTFRRMEFGGGAEKNLLDVAQHVAKRRPVAFYIAGGHVDERMRGAGPVFTMPSGGRLWGLPLDLLHMAWVVLRHRVRVIHAHERYSAFLAGILRRLLPLRQISTVHNRFPTRAALSLWGDRAIAVSHDIAQWLRDECAIPEDRIRVIHNGIADPPRQDADAIAALRAACGVRDGEVVLCSVGRLAPQKNFALLLAALARLKLLRWRLLLVGEGELDGALRDQAGALGIADRVNFLGRRSDVPLIMQSSDALLMSSSWEGFPYVVVEGLANSLPIVATDVGGVREGVVDGRTGLLVKPGDEAGMADAIARVVSDPVLRERLARGGRELFESSFALAAMLKSLDEEIEGQFARADRNFNK